MYDRYCVFRDNCLDFSQFLIYQIFEPECKADILHWFAAPDVDSGSKEDFIRDVINFNDECGSFYYYRAYLFAAEALAYFSDCSLGDAIVTQVLKWSYNYFRQEKSDWKIIPRPLVEAARRTLYLTDRSRVVAAFVKLVHHTESRTILKLAAQQLLKLDPGNKSAIAALSFLPEFVEKSCRSEEYLPNTAVQDPTAIAAKIHDMETTLHKELCVQAILSLKDIAVGSQIAIKSLVKFLEINKGDEICLPAAETLWHIDPGNTYTKSALVYILENSADLHLIMWTAKFLTEIDPGNASIQAALIYFLEKYPVPSVLYQWDEYLRSQCTAVIGLLGNIAFGNEIAIKSLLKFIRVHQIDSGLCLYAAEALWQIDPGNIDILSDLVLILEGFLDSTDSNFKSWRVAQVLIKINPANSLAINALSSFQESDLYENQFTAFRIIKNLVYLNPNNQLVQEQYDRIIIALIKYIQTFRDRQLIGESFLDPVLRVSYEDLLLEVAEKLVKVLPQKLLPKVVSALKPYLTYGSYQNTSSRYEAVLRLVWHCAENLSYRDFCRAWG